jgi:hypothetical protein
MNVHFSRFVTGLQGLRTYSKRIKVYFIERLNFFQYRITFVRCA